MIKWKERKRGEGEGEGERGRSGNIFGIEVSETACTYAFFLIKVIKVVA